MALVPTRQFCPTSTSVIDSLHFRYTLPFPLKPQNFCTIHYYLSSISTWQPDPRRKLRFGFKSKPFPHSIPIKHLCRSSWIDHWSKPHQQNGPKKPRPVLDYGEDGDFPGLAGAVSDYSSTHNHSNGISGGSTMEKIMERLRKVGYSDDASERQEKAPERVIEKGSIEDIFYVEEGMLPNTSGGFSEKSSLGEDNVFGNDGEVRFPWEKTKEEKQRSVRKMRKTSLAESIIPAPELSRLRYMAFHTKSKIKIGGGGVTQAVVEAIHEKWKMSEIARLKFEGSSALNMKRMHEILERKTGGLVIWRSGTSVILYRGASYEAPSVKLNKRVHSQNGTHHSSVLAATEKTSRDSSKFGSYNDTQTSTKSPETIAEDKNEAELLPEVRYDDEMDNFLDGLGPRYTDWPGDGPLPVDADMLPAIIPGYEPPFRILPYGVRSTLGSKEATALRRLSRVLPPHFALGRSRQLQGLAAAVVQLWDRSKIAKVALKRNVPLTTSERMAESLKKLTGGLLLSRNKDFLVFYRGKNFLSKDVAEALLERERLAKTLQDEEDRARLKASTLVEPNLVVHDKHVAAGTLEETLNANARWGKRVDDQHKEEVMREAEWERHIKLIRKLEGTLAFAERKLMKAEHALSKVEEFLKPAQRQADPESITEEERFMFRKLGLRMKAFLLLGRRGVFDGTVENMHLHWKYRELIKILVKAKSFEQVRKIALALEAESGGVLVSVDKVSKGYAIIVFRGKDYQRPSTIRPKNLLTKRKALARSIELQRREALNKHISALQRNVDKLRAEIERMGTVKDKGDEQLYDRLDSAYPTDNEESEEEGDEAYLETYDGSEYDDENDYAIHNSSKHDDESDDSEYDLHSDTNFSHDLQNQEPHRQRETSNGENEYADESNFSVPQI